MPAERGLTYAEAQALAARRAELAAEALSVVEEICDRADAMGLGLVKFMVSDVRRVIALAKAAGDRS